MKKVVPEKSVRPKRFCFFYGFLAAAYVMTLLQPQPFFDVASSETGGGVPARAECVMEAQSRRILFEHNALTPLPMASTTKVLTAVTVLEHCGNLDEEVCIPPEAVAVEGSSVYLKSGDIYTVKDLLYGLMLRSGNDCANALALYAGGSISRFSQLMNVTAEKAGALNSRFANPHGLPCEGHYTTARDLNLISCYAMQNLTFRTLVATGYYEPRGWANKNKMLKNYEGGVGIKTGYTKQAGRCLVSAAERDGMMLVCTVLNCPTTYERSAQLLDDAFHSYEFVRILAADSAVPIEIAGKTIEGCTGEDIYYPLLAEEKSLLKVYSEALEGAEKKKKGEIIGQIKIYLINRLLFSGNLYKL